MSGAVRIGDRLVGVGQPCFIIAEAGVNHNGDIALAKRLVDAAARCGCDAVKFQSFIIEDLVSSAAEMAGYQAESMGHRGKQAEMLGPLVLSNDQHALLKEYCRDRGIMYLCTPYEDRSMEFLDQIDVAAFKLASTDTTNLPFLKRTARKGRPVILSTGMSTMEEVSLAVDVLYSEGLKGKVVLLHATTQYPTPLSNVNLRAMETLRTTFDCPVGFSDHTSGIGVGPWAAAAGAVMVEKHITLDRNMTGPDHLASLAVADLGAFVRQIRDVEIALGDGVKRPMPGEIDNKVWMQKSIVARRTIPRGATITESDIVCKRPSTGLAPRFFSDLVGKRVVQRIEADHPVTRECVEWVDCPAHGA